MEKLESTGAALAASPVRLPVQMPLLWDESLAAPDPAQSPTAPVAPKPAPVGATDSSDERRAQMIAVQAGRFKMVCVSLLGLLLLSLRYFDS